MTQWTRDYVEAFEAIGELVAQALAVLTWIAILGVPASLLYGLVVWLTRLVGGAQ